MPLYWVETDTFTGEMRIDRPKAHELWEAGYYVEYVSE